MSFGTVQRQLIRMGQLFQQVFQKRSHLNCTFLNIIFKFKKINTTQPSRVYYMIYYILYDILYHI